MWILRMNPPIRCFECKKVIGNKWEAFWKLTGMMFDNETFNMVPNPEKREMSDDLACDKLQLYRNCCRNMMKSFVEY